MRSTKLLIALVTALALAACGGGEATSNGGNEAPEGANEAGGGGGTEVTVTAANFAFSPDEISVEPGEEVSLSFVNDDSAPHTFTSEDVGIDVKADAGETATGTFTAPDSGSADFQCTIHPAMTGTISVGGGSANKDTEKKDKEDKEEGDSGGGYDY